MHEQSPSGYSSKSGIVFLNLDYPVNLINFSINKFLSNIDNITALDDASDGTSTIVVPLPFKGQHSANSVKREMQNLSAKIGVQIKPVFFCSVQKDQSSPRPEREEAADCQQSVCGLQISMW